MTLASSTAGPEAVEAAIAIQKVHTALFPSHGPTPLHPLPKLAEQLGCKAVYAKDESSRFDLPAFKILGASWCACSMLGERWGLLPWDIEGIKQAAAGEPELTLYAATDGNHGRAVARTARLLGLKAHVFVPSTVEQWSIDAIASEGCPVTPVDDDYDGTVEAANAACRAAGKIGLLIQDMSWPGYEDAPKRIVEGYMTISAEINALVPGVTAVVVPVGVGSFAHSVVKYYGPGGVRDTSARIISAEPDAAPCLHESLKAGKLTNTPGSRFTIMPGLNCGTVNHQAWPDLQAAIQPQDAVVVNDDECRAAVADLNTLGVPAGPCGAATLAAARKVEFGKEDVVVLIVTEGNQEDK